MSPNLLRHHALSQIPQQDKRESVREYIKRSALMHPIGEQSNVLGRKKKREGIESDTVEDVDSMALQISDQSTDILDGKRAVKKRLEDRKRRRVELAEMRKSPSYNQLSPCSSRRKRFDRKIEEKKSRRKLKNNRSSTIQDRSRSKADRIRQESRSKEKKKLAAYKPFDLFRFGDPTSMKRDRVSIPQPKQGIFSRGTASPFAIEKPKVKTKNKRLRSPTPSTDDEEYESSQPSSIPSRFLAKIEKSSESRIRALEEQIKQLRNTVKTLQPSNNQFIRNDEIDETCLATSNVPEIDLQSTNYYSVQHPPAQKEKARTVINVGNMPWFNNITKTESNQSVIRNDEAPVLAFNGDKPDTHPNAWRSQHTLHHPGLHAIQKQYVDAGGANFLPEKPNLASCIEQKEIKDHERQVEKENAVLTEKNAELSTTAMPSQSGLPTTRLMRTQMQHENSNAIKEEKHDRQVFKKDELYHFDGSVNLHEPLTGDGKEDYALQHSSRPRDSMRKYATSLPNTSRERVNLNANISHTPFYGFEHRNQHQCPSPSNTHDNDSMSRFPNKDRFMFLQDDGLDKFAFNNADQLEQDMEECLYPSYDDQVAATIYTRQTSPPLEYTDEQHNQSLNQEELEGFWYPYRLI